MSWKPPQFPEIRSRNASLGWEMVQQMNLSVARLCDDVYSRRSAEHSQSMAEEVAQYAGEIGHYLRETAVRSARPWAIHDSVTYRDALRLLGVIA